MVAYRKLQQRKKEEGRRLHILHVLGMYDDLPDRVCGVGSETCKGCD